MACLTADGSLTESGREMLRTLAEPLSPEAVAERVGNPLYRVRASLREMLTAGLVEETRSGLRATEAGRQAAGG